MNMTRERPEVRALVEDLFRHHAAAMLAVLTRQFGLENIELAEEVVQDAMLQALRLWPFQGVPANPRGWLIQVARNKALDLTRRNTALQRRRKELERSSTAAEARYAQGPDTDDFGDERLAMIFACAHPALVPEARVALTLKAACGFSVTEIARAFLASEPTIAQRLVRAKKLIRERGVGLSLPDAKELPERLESVLQVIYLLFNEGHSASAGDALVRHELCGEAIWLAELLARRPETSRPKVFALLALMELQAARLPARLDESGDLVLLADQDRSKWDGRLIDRGLRHLDQSSAGDELTSYHLQAGIAAVHAVAVDHASTDWDRLLGLYDLLLAVEPSAIVALNRAVVVAMRDGAQAGLEALDAVASAGSLREYYLLPATRADLLRQLDRDEEAAACYETALALAANGPERRFLQARLHRCRRDRAAVLSSPFSSRD